MKKWMLFLFGMALFWYGCGLGDAQKTMKLATEAAAKQDWKTVKELSEKRIHSVPTDKDAAVLLALSLFHTESDKPASIDRAINCMRQVLTSENQRYDLYFIYGWILLNTGHFQEARIPLQTAYELHLKDPHNIGQTSQGLVKYALGRCCMMNGLYKEALKYYDQATKSTEFNDWSTLYNDIAFCHIYQRDYGNAMNALKTALEKNNLSKQKAEKELLKNPDAPLYDNPYEYILFLNTAVVTDYLSFPQYNPTNAAAFSALRQAWYNSAESMVAAAAKASPNASQQQELNNLQRKINLRKAALAGSK